MRRPEIVKEIKEAIQKVDPNATTILYGSEARGDARPDSDIDLLILVDGDKLSLDREGKYTMPLYEIEWSTGVSVSPTVMLRKNWEHRPIITPFYINVENEGVRLWKKTVEEYIPKAKAFIAEVESLIKRNKGNEIDQ